MMRCTPAIILSVTLASGQELIDLLFNFYFLPIFFESDIVNPDKR